MRYIMDANPNLDNYDRYDVLVGHDPSGTSLQNMEHWKQIVLSGKFQAYDFGSAKENNKHYGQPYPPEWNISNVRTPLRWFGGSSDELADLTDMNFAWSQMNKAAQGFYKIYDAGHCTFIWGKDMTPWMNDLFSMLKDKTESKKRNFLHLKFKKLFGMKKWYKNILKKLIERK